MVGATPWGLTESFYATLGGNGRWGWMHPRLAWFQPDPEHYVLELPRAELHIVTTRNGIACAWWTFIDEGWAYMIIGRT